MHDLPRANGDTGCKLSLTNLHFAAEKQRQATNPDRHWPALRARIKGSGSSSTYDQLYALVLVILVVSLQAVLAVVATLTASNFHLAGHN